MAFLKDGTSHPAATKLLLSLDWKGNLYMALFSLGVQLLEN